MHPGYAAQQNARPPELSLEAARSHLNRHTPGDFAHRLEQGESAVGQLDGLVGDGRDAAREEDLGEIGHGGQVEVGVDDLARLEAVVLDVNRLLHLHDHV